MVFGWSQIVIDLQPLVVLLTGRGELHGFSHTLPGATLIALFCAWSGKYLGATGLRILRASEYLPIRWPVAFASAFIGTYSHVFIDSIMHPDVQPFAPFSPASPLHGLLSIDMLNMLCVASAVVGGVVIVATGRLRNNN